MRTRKPLALAIAAASLSLALPQVVLAAGYALNEQSAHASGTANAGAAANPENASILFFNPAGMTKLEGTQISFGATVLDVDPSAKVNRATDTIGRPVAGSNGGDFVDLAVVPNFYITHTMDNFSAGIGVYAPFGLKADYDDDFRGRFLADKTEIEVISIQPSFAFSVTEQFSLGFGMNVMHAKGKLTRFQDYTGIPASLAAQGVLPPEAVPAVAAQLREGYFDTEGDDWELGWTAGMLFTPLESTNIGLTYRSEAKFDLKGDASLTQVPVNIAPLVFADFKENAKVPLTTPESVTLSLKQDFGEQWSLLLGTTWTRWSRFQNLDIYASDGAGGPVSTIGSTKYGVPGTSLIGHVPERWENTWSASIGAAFHFTPNWTLKAGYAFDESPVPQQNITARVPSSDRHWLTLGAQWSQGQNGWKVDGAFGYLIIDDVDVNEYEYTVAGPRVPGAANLQAKYDIDAWGAALQISKGF